MGKNLMKKLKGLPIYRQFLIISFIYILIVIAMFGIIVRSTQNVLVSNARYYADMSTQKFTNELDVLCLQLDVLSRQFQSEEIYQQLLSLETYHALDSSIVSEISSNISYIKCLNADIVDIAFSNELIHWSSIFSESDLDDLYQRAMSDYSSTNHSMGLMKSSIPIFQNNTYYVYCSNIYKNGKTIGCAFISLDINKLSLSSATQDAASSLFVMDANQNIYGLSTNSDYFTKVVYDTCESYLQAPDNNSLTSQSYNLSKDSFSIQMNYSETAQCYIISAVDINQVNTQLNHTWTQTQLVLVLVTLFTFLLGYILFINMINPLKKFNNVITKMRDEKQRHLSKPLDVDGCKEVNDLASTFSDLFSTIDELNIQIFETSSKLYEEKIRVQATEISFFRSQINPHFLYNVLELIRSLALSHEVPEIASIAIAMGKMYRYNTKGAPIVPFREELEMTKAYIEIQKYRFKDKFDILYNIPDEVLSVPVIKMILQPIVENSILHGIEPALHPCMLYIGCSISNHILNVEVRDDGVGMTAERLEEITKTLQEQHYDASNYVGINNTNARLKLQYGEAYGIKIQSQPDDGTIVTLQMPIQP